MSETEHVERFAVSATSENQTKTVVSARDFEFVIDEPASLDGTDDGPNPVEYLLGAWAGCLNVVVHTVAAEHDIHVEGVEVDVEGDLDPRKFLGVEPSVRAGYQEIAVSVDVETDADDEAVDALRAEIEERCPVGDTIGNATPTSVTVRTD